MNLCKSCRTPVDPTTAVGAAGLCGRCFIAAGQILAEEPDDTSVGRFRELVLQRREFIPEPEPEYVYAVRSNKPLSLVVGLGNMPSLGHSGNGYNALTEVGHVRVAESSGAAASVGHRMTVTLEEIR